ncbi:AraC family transcriptional regulator [Agromyces seonyuensis]|uniref:Helix-turn-helix domain-containing protein n=1 Tax=Agromyces seonyuensis TaxID=2662446 RepID=A0A6I4NVR6_9MICO|nr:AraC family transcriptional regulator [Agromyces seonyuensis]MWB98191.1 helix-turn-helix domain-containing protein [Agromyces seonyuensis]
MPTPLVLPWERTDPLAAALYRVRMRGAFYSWTEASGIGAVAMPVFPETLSFHIVAAGTAWLEVDDRPPVRLDAGSLALVPRGIGHRIGTAPGAPALGRADLLPQTMIGESFSVMHVGPADVPTSLTLLCGIVAFESSAVQDMLGVLPPVVVVDAEARPVTAALLPLLAAELRDPRPGGDAVATRLADVLVVEAVRSWLATSPDEASGWLAALRDPELGPAVAAIHHEPGRAWSLAELARAARLSRTVFAARFTELVGVPPMAYVASTRMRVARGMLAQGRRVADVAAATGYGSEAAFSRAYARLTGETPGRTRRQAA